MTLPPTVCMLGARERFCQAAALAISLAGWQIVDQIHSRPKGLPITGVKWLALDPAEAAALVAAAPDSYVAINALSQLYTHKAWRAESAAMLEDAIRLAKAQSATLMRPGNVYNFCETMPALLRIDTAQAATHDGNLRAVVTRAGEYLGSGTGSWLDKYMVEDLNKGRITWPAGLTTATHRAYLPDLPDLADLADAIVEAADHRDQLAAVTQLLFAGHAVTGQQWMNALSSVATSQGWLAAGGNLRVCTVP